MGLNAKSRDQNEDGPTKRRKKTEMKGKEQFKNTEHLNRMWRFPERRGDTKSWCSCVASFWNFHVAQEHVYYNSLFQERFRHFGVAEGMKYGCKRFPWCMHSTQVTVVADVHETVEKVKSQGNVVAKHW